MAAPTIATPRGASGALTSSTTHAVTMPASATTARGVLVVTTWDSAPIASTASSGWSKIAEADAGSVGSALFYKRPGVALAALSVSLSFAEEGTYVVLVFDDAASSEDPTATAATATTANGNPPSHTPAGGSRDYLWIAAHCNEAAAVATAAPSGYANLTTATGGASGASTATAERTATASSENPGAFTSPAEDHVAWTIAIPPTPAVTGTAAAPLGGLVAAASATPTHPASGSAPLGALTGAATGVVTAVNAAAPLGALGAAASAVRSTPATAVAPLGRVIASASAIRTTAASASAPLGALAGAAEVESVSYLGAAGVALNPVVWRVDRDTLDIVGPPLPEWELLELSPIANAAGSCRLVLPAGVAQFTDVYDNVSASPQRDQEIEVWLAGNAEHRTRWLLQQKDGDDLHPGQLWTFDGAGLEALLAEVLVGPQDTETLELTFSGVTYGTVLITALQQAQERDGVLVGVTWDFTVTHDSNGDPWAGTIADLKFAPDDTLLAVAESGPNEVFGEFAMGPDRVLHAWNYGARGTDRTTGTNPLRLQAGANLTAAARRESSRAGDAATATLAKGAEGQYQWATDATAEAQRGRRVEVAVDAGNTVSEGGVLAAAQGQLEVLKAGVTERTHGVVFGPGLPLPGLDYDIADWGLSVTGNQFTAQRIAQWTLSFRQGERASGTVRTNTRIQTRLDRLRRDLDRVRRGAAVVGTSTPSPDLDDGKNPAQVTGVTASSSAYLDADGATQASVIVGWSAVTTNADATAAGDVVGYLTQYRYTAGGSLPAGWSPLPPVSTTVIDFDRVVAGTALEVRVAAIDKFDHIGAWSTPYALTTGADATPPPVLPAPSGSAYLGLLKWDWNGKGAAGESMPPDFLEAELHLSTVSGFTPNRPLLADGKTLDTAASTTFRDRLTGAGELPVDPGGSYGVTWYAKWVAVDRSRNASAASSQGSAVRTQAADGDVSALSVGKLVTGIMTALMTVSGIIRTATSGSRVELDANGLRCYLGSVLVLDFSIPSSALSLLGKLTTGAGVGTGSTIVVDATSPPAIRMYPNATSQRTELIAQNTTRPDSSTAAGFQLRTLNSSSQTEGFQIDAWSTNVWLGHKTTAGAWAGGLLVLQQVGGLAGLFSNGASNARLQVGDSGQTYVGTDDQYLRVSSAGEVLIIGPAANRLLMDAAGTNVSLRVDANNRLTLTPGGSQFVSSGTVKSFVVDHPTDPDRWLVHACTESPTAGVEYTGTAVISDHLAFVELPQYFEDLCEEDGRTVHLTPELAVHEGMAMVSSAAPSRIADGRFHIVCPAPDGTRVHWLVKATRRHAAFDTEPLRADVDVHGDGPYRWIPGTETS